MIVLDTNVVSELMAPHPDAAVLAWADEHDPRSFVITAVTRAEIRFGIARLPVGQRRERIQRAADAFFGSQAARALPFDEQAADLYGVIVADRERMGNPIGVPDAQIAAIARSRGAMVATRDTGGFADTGVLVVNPFDLGQTLG